MTLLSSGDRETVRKHLADLVNPVRLLLFTQTFGASETATMSRQILDEVAALHELITVEEVNFVLEKDRAQAFGISGIPAIVVMRGEDDTRMRFLGAPAGYEFMSLVEAIIAAGTNAPGLSAETLDKIGRVTEHVDIKVFVTPTCPHCPKAVTLAHRMALASPLITATCIEATEFLDLSRQFRVNGVPKTVVDGSIEIMGALPEPEFVDSVLGLTTELGVSAEG